MTAKMNIIDFDTVFNMPLDMKVAITKLTDKCELDIFVTQYNGQLDSQMSIEKASLPIDMNMFQSNIFVIRIDYTKETAFLNVKHVQGSRRSDIPGIIISHEKNYDWVIIMSYELEILIALDNNPYFKASIIGKILEACFNYYNNQPGAEDIQACRCLVNPLYYLYAEYSYYPIFENKTFKSMLNASAAGRWYK